MTSSGGQRLTQKDRQRGHTLLSTNLWLYISISLSSTDLVQALALTCLTSGHQHAIMKIPHIWFGGISRGWPVISSVVNSSDVGVTLLNGYMDVIHPTSDLSRNQMLVLWYLFTSLSIGLTNPLLSDRFTARGNGKASFIVLRSLFIPHSIWSLITRNALVKDSSYLQRTAHSSGLIAGTGGRGGMSDGYGVRRRDSIGTSQLRLKQRGHSLKEAYLLTSRSSTSACLFNWD